MDRMADEWKDLEVDEIISISLKLEKCLQNMGKAFLYTKQNVQLKSGSKKLDTFKNCIIKIPHFCPILKKRGEINHLIR